ncbi:pentatricopeptide repeat domain-containing protein [Diaporthe helianthi]|uniref:Pentatricopeptide repeat domain-containing protein n=1 Tax=Diaporthe helianthi TaxID=158607 RepID=A0A2P5HX80_DIAHE|nr:pentatricopeptide repeat domain-containing protein [Diaporthe helianthi]
MSGVRITVDGLWRCLCPSIDATVAKCITTIQRRPRPLPVASSPRCLHTTGRLRESGVESKKDPFASLGDAFDENKALEHQIASDWLAQEASNEQSLKRATTSPAEESKLPTDNTSEPNEETLEITPAGHLSNPVISKGTSESQDGPGDIVQWLVSGVRLDEDLPRATTEQIYEALRKLRNLGNPKCRRTTAALVRHLLASGEEPDTFLYETFLMAHAATDGSADIVNGLLREMRHRKLPWSSAAYHAALQALAIHPDYLLRNTIIKEMKERWLEITPEGHQHIAIGLLRDEQYELALEKLHEMHEKSIQVEGWVFDIFIYVFGKMEFLDDALRIVRHRIDRGHEIPVNVWYFLLEVCSKGQNISATGYIWNRAVQSGIVNPSDGVALSILNMAAVYGDTEFCTPVIEYLAARGTRLNRHHYEALIDAYIAQVNVEKALEVYCIMQAAGVEVTNTSTGSLAFAFTRDSSLIDQAIYALPRLRVKYSVPIAVFNCVLNEVVKANTEQPDDSFAKALGLYRRIREFVPDGPNLDTFRNLLWKCTRPELAQFFAGEMFHFDVLPNLVITTHMYRINVEFNGPSHRAKDYFFKVAPHFSAGKDLSTGRRKAEVMDLSVKLIKRLIGERDPEAWRILDICKKNGLEEATIDALRAEVEAGSITGARASPRDGLAGQDTGFGQKDATQPSV